MPSKSPETTVEETVDATRRMTQEVTSTARQTAERGMNMTRQLVDVWAASAEASLKAAIDLQNVAITAGRSLVDVAGGNNKAAFQVWTDLVNQAQKATLDAWQEGKRLGEQIQTAVTPK